MLQRFFQKYSGFLRNLKASYVINNFLNAGRLKHNRSLYQRYGLKKNIFSPVSSKDFSRLSMPEDIPWLDRENRLELLEQNETFQQFEKSMQDLIRQFERDGMLIIEGFYSEPDTKRLNREVDTLLQEGKTGYNFTGRKIFNLWKISEHADRQFFRNPDMMQLLGFLLGRPVVPFQSLNFTLGSEQRAHSDAIHMTTAPAGYLIATWAALEDVQEGSGPLEYYPGSHRLPFISTQDYQSGNSTFTLGHDSNRHYEDKMKELIAEKGLEKKVFLPKRGDVLIWHSNLIHGGTAITKPGATRRSMVCHYYGKDVICYHEMSQRPALMPKGG